MVSRTSSTRLSAPHGGEDMGRISALPTVRFEQPVLATLIEQGVEQQRFRPARKQAAAELAEYGMVEPGVGQVERQAYFQSSRARTASAACRSERFSANWKRVTRARRHGVCVG